MKIRIGKLTLSARSYFAETHGIWLIQFGPCIVEPRYLPRLGATIIDASPAERSDLLAHGCPIEAILPGWSADERPTSRAFVEHR
jgi:hypothetical protein